MTTVNPDRNSGSGREEDRSEHAIPLSRKRKNRKRLFSKMSYSSWIPSYLWQSVTRSLPTGPVHIILALADHFEPSIIPGNGLGRVPRGEQAQRVETWCKKYPKLVERWRDSDGRPLVHTYFYPAEQYEPEIVARLAEHCHQGWGEIEIHLHHGIGQPDTAENTRRQLVEFRDALSRVHGCLSQVDGSDLPRYAFVHGNFTLANSVPGRACGVDNEMAILAETGCYADFTLPTATFHRAQIAKVNSLYECSIPLHQRAPHRKGRDLRYGRPLSVFPIMVQGPLAVVFGHDARSRFMGFENSALTGVNPASLKRLRLWKKAGICVQGKPDWLFVKLHCHGMDPRDTDAMVGDSFRQFLQALVEGAPDRGETLHFVTAREMMNIICAACDGRDGNPGEYRDYRFKRLRSRSGESRPARGSQVLLKG